MRGSRIAEQIAIEMQRDKYYKNKKRAKCIIDKKKQCTVCKYQKICEDVEIKEEELK